MPHLIWSEPALLDLVRLHDFLRENSQEAARRAIKAIRQGVQNLGRYPEMGRPVEDLPSEFREWVIQFGQGAYLALYHLAENEIVILAVRHGREATY